ncbi:MAG: hypothetical protein K2K93_02520 [Muribaculaceae bacterium]|nr:hypothetical protein [Muribaculaceae bacterium]
MTEDNKLRTEEKDIERLLAPRCEFRVSSGFKERVLAQAQTQNMTKRRRPRRIPIIATSAAAVAAIAIAIIAYLHFFNYGISAVTTGVTASVETPAPIPSDTIMTQHHSEYLADASTTRAVKTEETSAGSQKRNSKTHNQRTRSSNDDATTKSTETEPRGGTEGEMRQLKKDDSMDPDEIRVRMIESRRNAEMAYLDRMREEIETNRIYVAQLMTLEGVP